MSTYVAFLRGINVGGINIKMADLARSFEAIGLSDVTTILASGNVRFTTKEPNSPFLKRKIEDALTARFNYDAWVIILDLADLQRVIEAFPYPEDDPEKQPYVMFLADPSVAEELLSVQDELDPAVDRIQSGDGVIYWEVMKGETIGSVFGKHSAMARFKPLVTTRNLRTLRKILG